MQTFANTSNKINAHPRRGGWVGLLFLFYSLLSFSQITFEEGYVITLKGDTIKGEIKLNHKKEIDLYSKIMFKISETEKKSYNPAKIKEYNIRGESFISKELHGENVFMRRASRGTLVFYEYQFLEPAPTGDEAVAFEYYIQKAGTEELIKIKENKFRKQLAELMSDNQEVVAMLEDKKTVYSEIIDIVKKYNGEHDEE